jgi:PhnB protein
MAFDSAASSAFQCSIAPWLSVRNSTRVVEFYKSAFGATELFRLEDSGKGVVARLSADGAEFWLSDASLEHGNISPESLGGGSARMILTVADRDAMFQRVLAPLASEILPVGEEHGCRLGRVVDPFGHHWEICRQLQS